MHHKETVRTLFTHRLELIASSALHVRTELETPEQLTHLLKATVSPAWPSGEYDRDAMEFFLARFEEGGARVQGWYGWYALCSGGPDAVRALVGAGGYFGPPNEHGTVEVGYSILPEWQRLGYAREMVQALVKHARSFAEVRHVIAHTATTNGPSIKVLLACGFQVAGTGDDAHTLRFEHALSSAPRPLQTIA